MAIFKVERIGKNHDLMSKLNYIMKPEASSSELIFTRYLMTDSPYGEMMAVKKCYSSSQNDLLYGRQYFEFMLSLNEDESSRVTDFANCLNKVIDYISDFKGTIYQVIAAIHTNTDNLHAHIIVNNIDMITGKRFLLPPVDLFNLKQEINSILEEYAFEGIKFGS